MSNDITAEQVAFDFLAREYVELAAQFGEAQPTLSAQKLSDAEQRLNKQFAALEALFSKSGMEREVQQLVGPARTLITAILEQAKARHPKVL